MFPLLGAVPRCSGCCPREIFSTPGCHPGSWGDLLGKNALCAFSAALFRQLRVTLLTQSWSFSLQFPDAGAMLCRPSLALSPPGKGAKPAQNEFRSTKKFSAWFTGNTSIAQSKGWCVLCGLACWLRKPFHAGSRLDQTLKIHCPLPPLCTDFVSSPFWSVYFVSFSDLDVLSSCQGFF